MNYLSSLTIILNILLILRNNKFLITKTFSIIWLLLIIFQWLYLQNNLSIGECGYFYTSRICYEGLQKAGFLVFISTLFIFFFNEIFRSPVKDKSFKSYKKNLLSKSFFKPTISSIFIIFIIIIPSYLLTGGTFNLSNLISISISSESRNIGTLVTIISAARILYLRKIIARSYLCLYDYVAIFLTIIFNLLFSRINAIQILFEIYVAYGTSFIFISNTEISESQLSGNYFDKLTLYFKALILSFLGFLSVVIYGSVRDFTSRAIRDNVNISNFDFQFIYDFSETIYIKQVESFLGLASAASTVIDKDFSYTINYIYHFFLSFITLLIPSALAKDIFSSFFPTELIYSSTVIPSILEFGYISFGTIGVVSIVLIYYFISRKIDIILRKFAMSSESENAAITIMFGVTIVFTLRGSPWAGLASGFATIIFSYIYISLLKILNSKSLI